MSSLNKIILIGKVASDPIKRVTNSGYPMLRFSLEVDRQARSNVANGRTDIINIIVWGELADQQTFNKNALLLVEGRINNRSFDDDEGNRKWVTEIDAREVKELSGSVISSESTEGSMPQPKDDADFFNSVSAEISEKSSEKAPEDSIDASLEEKPLDSFNINNFDFGNDTKETDSESDLSANIVEEDIPF